MGVTAAVVGGVLGAGGSVAGGILGKEKPSKPLLTGGTPPAGTDPLNALLSQDILAQLGFFDPQVAQAASPLRRALDRRLQIPDKRKNIGRTIGGVESLSRFLTTSEDGDLEGAITEFSADDFRFLQKMGVKIPEDSEVGRKLAAALRGISPMDRFFLTSVAGAVGLSLEELIQQEIAHRATVAQQSERFSALREQAFDTRTEAGRQIRELLSEVPGTGGLDALTEQSRDRILRGLDFRKEDLLKSASFGGFNPAGGLEELERDRSDVDLDAFSQAVALLSGEQSVFGTRLDQLRSFENPSVATQSGLTLAGLRTGLPAPGQVTNRPLGSNPLGTALSAAGNTLGSAIFDIGLNRSSRGPAVNERNATAAAIAAVSSLDTENNFGVRDFS